MGINEQYMLIIQRAQMHYKTVHTTHNITTLLPRKFDLSKNEFTSYYKYNLNI